MSQNRNIHVKENPLRRIVQRIAPEQGHLLVIDDEDHIRSLFTEFFTKRGYRVTPAANLDEAEEALKAGTFDLVLQDVVLPDGDGIEFIPVIRSYYPDLPVIVLTALGYDEEVLQDAIKNEATSYVSKLLPLDQVAVEIRRILKLKQQEGAAPAENTRSEEP